MDTESRKQRVALAALCCALVAIPFLVVRFPPVTDLPQQAAQIRLLLEALADPAGPYRVQWATPYSLSYALLGLCWACFGPLAAGRVAMLALGVAWTVAAHALAARRGRSPYAAVVASLFFFNASTYWGFYSFLAGWPVFVAWFLFTTRPARLFGVRDALALAAGALLLYVAHALWFVAGLVWLAVATVSGRTPLKVALLRASCVAPVAVAAALWYRSFASSSFASPPMWLQSPLERLTSAEWLTDSTFGGLRGPLEGGTLLAVLLWLGVAAWQRRGSLREAVDGQLLLCAGTFFIAALLLPHLYDNTFHFGERWWPLGVIALVIAMPVPEAKPAFLAVSAVGLATAFVATTALTWVDFERDELSGLAATLDAIPPKARVLGLDFVKDSPRVKGRPYLHMSAYAQVLRGGALNFSFAEYPPMLVVFRDPASFPWTPKLNWVSEDIMPTDFRYFDYVIVQADDARHARLASYSFVGPVTESGRWRLYRVIPPAAGW